MLEFWRSLLRQSNPSTLTVAGLRPNFILTHPPLRADDDGDDGDGTCNVESAAANLSSPNRSSCTSGFAALVGGDPQKYGGDDASCVADCSEPRSSCKTTKSKITNQYRII